MARTSIVVVRSEDEGAERVNVIFAYDPNQHSEQAAKQLIREAIEGPSIFYKGSPSFYSALAEKNIVHVDPAVVNLHGPVVDKFM